MGEIGPGEGLRKGRHGPVGRDGSDGSLSSVLSGDLWALGDDRARLDRDERYQKHRHRDSLPDHDRRDRAAPAAPVTRGYVQK